MLRYSHFVLVQEHVHDSISDRILSLAVVALKDSLCDMSAAADLVQVLEERVVVSQIILRNHVVFRDRLHVFPLELVDSLPEGRDV